MENRVTKLLNIKYPIISGGMVWCSGWRLASAVSNAGGLGLLGAGSMHVETLKEHITKCKEATDSPFGVNVPLMYPEIDKLMEVIISEKIKVVVTSAGNPSLWTAKLKEAGAIVIHVVSSSKFAVKAESAGVDAIICEGFEAGGHNGKEETTTMVLVPKVCGSVSIPVIAAGGIATGESVAAALALGADGVQIGTRFALSTESSASEAFKKRCLSLIEGETVLCMKNAGNVRMVKNEIHRRVAEAESQCATVDQIRAIVGKGRAKMGIFEGDINEGLLEIGEVATLVNKIESVDEIFADIIKSHNDRVNTLQDL